MLHTMSNVTAYKWPTERFPESHMKTVLTHSAATVISLAMIHPHLTFQRLRQDHGTIYS